MFEKKTASTHALPPSIEKKSAAAIPAHMPAPGNKKWGDVFHQTDMELSQEYYLLAIKASNTDYTIDRKAFYIGDTYGTNIFYNTHETSLDHNRVMMNKTGIVRYSTAIHMEELGLMLGTKFSSLPRQYFSLGFGKKEVSLDPYKRYLYNRAQCQPCIEKIGHAKVTSNPIYFQYFYDRTNTWDFRFRFQREKTHLDTLGNLSVATNIYEFTSIHKLRKTDLEVSLGRYSAAGALSTNNIHLSARRKIKPHIDLFLTFGMFTQGLPTAGGIFSDIGELFVFDYLDDGTFADNFTKRFGYFSLGMNFSLR